MNTLKKLIRRICYGTISDNAELVAEVEELRQELIGVRGAVDSIKVWMDAYHKELLEKKHLLDVYSLAAIKHQKVFPKYRDCHKGKDFVLFACGPTLDAYDLKLDAVSAGVNRAYKTDKVALDYLFIQDYAPDLMEPAVNYNRGTCKKFFGVHHCAHPIAQSYADNAEAEQYYFVEQNAGAMWEYPPDVSTLPFATYGTVAHVAATFALHTGVKKLYLVGCDTTNSGHSKGMTCKSANTPVFSSLELIMDGWHKFKDYAERFYPECEVISINPVGLRGVFKDVYTKSYLATHRELVDVEVIN